MPDEPLTMVNALKPEGVLLVGSLAVRQLQTQGLACFMVNQEGVVEVVPAYELKLDGMTEPDALMVLLNPPHKYTDQQLEAYLRARDWRLRSHG